MTSTKFITIHEAAAILGCDRSTAGRLCKRGELVAQKVGQSWRIDAEHCRRYAKTYTPSKTPNKPNTRAFNKPVGKGWKKKLHPRPQVWESVDDQIAAALAGEVAAVRLDSVNNVIGHVYCER